MNHKPYVFTIFCLLLLAAAMAGCASQGDDSQGVELANPASVYCQGLGYEEENRENEAGQYGVCLFPDGSECDSWDFLAGRCGQEQSYCAQQGFELIAVENSNIGTCVFEDGSTCGEFSYFQGDCQPGENLP